MITRTMLRICLLIILSVLCLEPAWTAIAEDCQECDRQNTPTPAGNAEYLAGWPCKCTEAKPMIYDNDDDDLIPSAGAVNLWVNSGGNACPPYTWSISGMGWSVIDDDGDNQTDNDLETITLSLINTIGKTCGTHYSVYCTVTVTDNCGETDNIIMKYSGGKWGNDTVICGLGGAGLTRFYGNPLGKNRYYVFTTQYCSFTYDVYKCSDTCPAYVLANQSALGFPASDGTYFFCTNASQPVSCSIKQSGKFGIYNGSNGYDGYASKGWGFNLYKQTWSCP
jgi:hypothetical protein